jgi:hypothetical protein
LDVKRDGSGSVAWRPLKCLNDSLLERLGNRRSILAGSDLDTNLRVDNRALEPQAYAVPRIRSLVILDITQSS